MKKFLSILLALAVGFTFTFGSAMSAFAATTVPTADKELTAAEMQNVVDKAYYTAKATLLKAKEDALYSIFENKDSVKLTEDPTGACEKKNVTYHTITITKKMVETVYDKNIYNPALAQAANEYTDMCMQISAAQKDTESEFLFVVDNEADKGRTSDKNSNGKYDYGIYTTFSLKYAKDADGLVDDTALTNDYQGLFKTVDAEVECQNSDLTGHAAHNYTIGKKADGTEKKAVGKAAFDQVVEDVQAAIAAVDESKYSDDAKEAARSPREIIRDAKTDALNDIAAIVAKVSKTTEYTAIVAKTVTTNSGFIKAIEDIYTPATGQAYPTGTFYDVIKDVPTLADEPTEAAKLAWAQNYVLSDPTNGLLVKIDKWANAAKAEQNNVITAEKLKKTPNQTIITAAEKKIADVETQAAAAKEIVNYLVKDTDSWKDILSVSDFSTTSPALKSVWNFTGTASGATATAKTYTFNLTVPAKNFAHNYSSVTGGKATYNNTVAARIAGDVAGLKAAADKLKSDINIDGTTAINVDKLLEDAVDNTYYGSSDEALPRMNTEESVLLAKMNELVGTTTSNVVINSKSYRSVENYSNINVADYDLENYNKVGALYEETVKAIYSSKTVADAEAAFLAGYAKFLEIPTKADRTNAQNGKEFKKLLDQYKTDIKAYATYKNAGLKATDYSWNPDTMANGLYTEIEKAYTIDALNVAYEDAKKEIDALKSIEQLTEAKKAIETKIAALPKTVTVADKETLAALKIEIAEHNDYCDLIGASAVYKVVQDQAVENGLTDIKTAEAKAINDAYAALKAKADAKTLTLADQQAVEKLRADYNAFVEFYNNVYATEDNKTPALGITTADGDVKALEGAISVLRVENVEQMIAKLPAEGSDQAAIKAAREAYNALGLAERVSVDAKYYDKLVDAEKLIKFTAEDAKAYVQDLAIAVRTAKVGKKVKVTVNADVQTLIDNGYTVTYKFYKSTKKGSGYKNTVNKPANTYTNTNPVKGKNYYKVKLVVKNADGAVVATTPLTQCKYGVRTIK